MKKTILGLDLGTNSIGWALVEQDFENKQGNILGMGSRIIPMSQDILGEFSRGNSVSQTAARTAYRSTRRLRERFLLRRERLHRVLNQMGFLPGHYAAQIDFGKRPGKFLNDGEPKIAYDQGIFIFKESFQEMLADFGQSCPDILKDKRGNQALIPYDWTIYYLRKKALSKKIEKEELAWLLLNFNQKRGYYQSRDEQVEENDNKLVECYSLTVVDVIPDEPQKGKSDVWYSLVLENGWVYRRSSKMPLSDWKGKVRDFIVTTELNDDGSVKTDKDGKEKRSFRAPSESDWTLRKKKTEQDIETYRTTVGVFIYDNLLKNPRQKIKGKLVRTIERKFYKDELVQILEKQKQFHPELNDKSLLFDCVRELYKNNEDRQLILGARDMAHLFIEDIIFYQRPLRSQKNLIAGCSLEFRKYRDKTGAELLNYLKVIPKSNPYYQEFRLWQWLYNLNIYLKDSDGKGNDILVTPEFLDTVDDYVEMYDFLASRKEIDQKSLLTFLLTKKGYKGKLLHAEAAKYRWNYVEDKTYPCNETRGSIMAKLNQIDSLPEGFLTREVEQKLWHLIYSVSDVLEYEKALRSFASRHGLDPDSFYNAFRKFRPFNREYGAFSEKAIRKLLPLMRMGKYWDWNAISDDSKSRIEKLITGEVDESISNRVREKALNLHHESDFQGLPLWLAQYIVYGRHSESAFAEQWRSPDDIGSFLSDFKQHSLRNPIVEQIVTETLRVVKDIWLQYGRGVENFFDEIHIELGRDMKNSAEERGRITQKVTENENTNMRIKALLSEMLNDPEVSNVRPFSPMQQEILAVYEDGVLNSDIEIEDDIRKISKTAQPSPADLRRYKLWLEQKYRSPYTGEIIPLNRLFTPDYEIEHIIPQSRYFDNSFSNKVICESAVNKLKDNYIGLAFIKKFGGTKVECGMGKNVTVFTQEEYEDFVKRFYAGNRSKRTKLMLEEIPEAMIERQLNDTRYVSKYISSLLSNIVRADDGNDQGPNSKNLIQTNGKITTALKKDWGLTVVWNELLLPRFQRLNQLKETDQFTAWSEKHQKFIPAVPLEDSRGFSTKRLDHRHHALDALVIACTSRDHISLLNNLSAQTEKTRYDLKRKLMSFKKVSYSHPHTGEKVDREVPDLFIKPWDQFTVDARSALEKIIVSFKQNLRVINKATNYYEKYIFENGVKTKSRVKQQGTNWAIRKPMHKDTVSGKVNLPWMKTPKGSILTATRKSLDTSFDLKAIKSITDTGIQKILQNYLLEKGSPEAAFTPEGIEDMNNHITRYNNGKPHQPIYKVRVFEVGSKFPVGVQGNKKDKYVEAAKGTNLFFAIYDDEKGGRSYDSIPLNLVIERLKQGLDPVPLTNSKGKLLFYLSPNDLVYVQRPDTVVRSGSDIANYLVYKFVSCTGGEGHFIPQSVSTEIVKNESGTNSKSERMQDFYDGNCLLDSDGKPVMIKANCIKLKVDRLGQVSI